MRDEDTRKQEIQRKGAIVKETRMRNPGTLTRGLKEARLYRADQGTRTQISGSHMHLLETRTTQRLERHTENQRGSRSQINPSIKHLGALQKAILSPRTYKDQQKTLQHPVTRVLHEEMGTAYNPVPTAIRPGALRLVADSPATRLPHCNQERSRQAAGRIKIDGHLRNPPLRKRLKNRRLV